VSNSARTDVWPKLLELALRALATLPARTRWSWGGGTALARHLGHRESDDIDIFLSDSRSLRLLSPQRNEVVRGLCESWQEPGHYLKLERPEGEVDFIVGSLLTEPGTRPWTFLGRSLPLETAAEVLAKKLRWRGSNILARDVFDLAATLSLAPEEFAVARRNQPEGARRVADQIRRRQARLKRELPLAVRPLPGREACLEADLLALAAALDPAA